MAAKDPVARSLNARIAAHASWAQTPIRAERTRNAHKASPASVDYWLARVDPSGVMSEGDKRKAAENARSAHMARLVLARRKKASRKPA